MPSVEISKVSALISGIDNLPTPPVVYSRINESISDPNSSAYRIASIISEDPATSAKILRLSNSAFYGSRTEISSVKQAIITIGMEAIKSLVLSTSIFGAFKTSPELARLQDEFWRHSLAVASACRVIIRALSSQWIQDADKVFSAGLLHDIGKLVMLTHLSKEWQMVSAKMKEKELPRLELERETLGFTHQEIGIALAERWHLPEAIKDAVAYHHDPLNSPRKESLAPLVYFGDLLTHMVFGPGEEEQAELSALDLEVLNRLKIKSDSISKLRTGLLEEYAKSEVFMQIAQGL